MFATLFATLFATSLSAQTLHPSGNMFSPQATPARLVSELSELAAVICLSVFIVVAGLLAYAVIRFGYREGDSLSEPPQVYGSNQVEIAWTVIPILIVFVLSMSTRASPRPARIRRSQKTRSMSRSSGTSGGGSFNIPISKSPPPTSCTSRSAPSPCRN